MRGDADWQRFAIPLGFVRLVLLVDWDPIGVFGYPGAMDEYDSYAVEVYDLLCDGVAKHKIADYLRGVEKERMGVRGRADATAVAEKLRAVYRACQQDAEPSAP